MRGILEQRGEDSWRVRAYAGRQGGKVRWVSRTVTGGKRDAQRALAKLVTEVESGQVTAGHPVSLGELVDRWLDDSPAYPAHFAALAPGVGAHSPAVFAALLQDPTHGAILPVGPAQCYPRVTQEVLQWERSKA